MKGVIGRKVGMTRVFDQDGNVVPVTVIETGPCPVIQVKTKDRDGYDAVQLGFGSRKENRTNRSLMGRVKKAGVPPVRIMREVRSDGPAGLEAGSQVGASVFKVGERVKVTGFSKGKGFQGVVKRW
jgi:large subunit ribosomal protein L3